MKILRRGKKEGHTDVTETALRELYLARVSDRAHDELRVRIARRRGKRTTVAVVGLTPACALVSKVSSEAAVSEDTYVVLQSSISVVSYLAIL